MEVSTLESVLAARSASVSKAVGDVPVNELVCLLQPNGKFEDLLRHTKGTAGRIFYHAAYLEAFGRAAPFGGIPDRAMERITSMMRG